MYPDHPTRYKRPDVFGGVVTVTLWCVFWGSGFFPRPVATAGLPADVARLTHVGLLFACCPVVLFAGNGSWCALVGDATVYPRFRVC